MHSSTKTLSALALVAAATLTGANTASAAITIDNFSDTSLLEQIGPGSTDQIVSAVGALGGERKEEVTVVSGNGKAALAVNVNSINGLSVSSEAGVTAVFSVTYGIGDPNYLNTDFSGQLGLLVRIISSDIGSIANSVTLRSGLNEEEEGVSTANFTVPSLVGQFGGPAAPVDVLIPFASLTPGADLTDIDQLTFTFRPPANGDYSIKIIGTYVPEPTVLGLLAPGVALLGRRRKA